MSFVNIISAMGNNSGIYPLLVRDCGIENLAKVTMTYNQNLKESKNMAINATRERFIDEYGTSAVWLGGIPLMDCICNIGIKKIGYNPYISPKLFKENSVQGIKYNIEKFKRTAPDEISELEKILKNKSKYNKLLSLRFVLSTSIPAFVMGFVLPRLNFGLTDKLQGQKRNCKNTKKNNSISFKGLTSTLSNMTTVQKMAVTDGGLTIGRVDTARNKNEKIEMTFKMTMMMILNYILPPYLAEWLDKASNKFFKTYVNLDPKLLSDKEFINSIKNNTIEMPKDNIIEFLDRNPKSDFSKLCKKYCGVKYLKNNVRDPRVYIDEEKIKTFQEEIMKFSSEAKKEGNVDKFAKKALKIKSINIISNICISSFLLAAALPKITFILRKQFMGFDAEPGLVDKIV